MKVVNFCTKLGGGAGGAAENFHYSLIASGHRSILINSKDINYDKKIFKVNFLLKKIINYITFKVYKYLKFYKEDYFFYSSLIDININFYKLIKYINFKPDVLVFHSIQNFLTIDDFEKLFKYYNVKIYWMIYDMGPFTGGCHYSWTCNKYSNICENCNASNYFFLKNFSYRNLQKKKIIFDKIGMKVLPHSKYILNQVKQSSLFCNAGIHLLNLGFDNKIFYKIDKKVIRNKYKIPYSKFIFLFATPDLMTKRKGIQILRESLSMINYKLKKQIQIITLGRIDKKFYFGDDIEHINYDYSNSLNFINEIYNLSDVFVSPAIEDSGNSMLIQSLFTGTPFVSFNIAYGYDLNDYGLGYVCKTNTAKEFSAGLKHFILMDKNKYRDISNKCIKVAKEKYSNVVQIKNFINIVNS